LDGLAYEDIPGALDDADCLTRAVADVDVVYHCAGATKARRPEDLYDVNAGGTARLADACLGRETPPLLVYVSSQAAAGPAGDAGPRCEDDGCAPVSDYGRSKLLGEDALRERRDALPYVVLRPCAIYGPRDTEMFLFFKFIKRGIEPALGWEGRYVSLCYVDDLIDAMLLAGEGGNDLRGRTYFIAHDEAWDWSGIAKEAAAAFGVKTRRVRVPKAVLFGAATLAELGATLTGRVATLNRAKAREMWQRSWLCDVGKAKRELGFTPRVGFAEGAKLVATWYREQGWL
jgi:nucleoside-diphosphate-sugar epimerase